MATAALQFSFVETSIDAEKSVIRGVKIAELGKVAVFKGPDGKPRKAKITKKHVNAFLEHAGNRAIPVHWTHDYLADDADRLHAKVGALKNFRKNEQGNPIADFYVAPTDYRDNIFWSAENDPENMMFSAVFSYDPNDPESLPQDFQAADLVERGAATTALFSEPNNTNTMTADEIKALVAPMIADAIKAAAAQPEVEVEIAAAAEAEAGVTDEDKKPEDEAKPASLRAALRIARATNRLTLAALTKKIDESKAETVTLAAAQFTAALGKSGTFTPTQGGETKMTRAQFNALPASAQMSFARKGGKIEE